MIRRKAVRAAFFLIPLMGIHNIFYLTDYHYDKSWKFATWLYITSFLKTFEGFFVSVLYCFLNGEVNMLLGVLFLLIDCEFRCKQH